MGKKPHNSTRMGRCLTTASAIALSGSAFFGLAVSAHAQTAAPDAVEEVIVTGSRVIQNGFKAPTPLTVVTSEAILA